MESMNGAVPIAGEYYNLTCNVFGADRLNPVITYQWRKSGDSSRIGTNSSTLLFAPVRVSNMGNYSCTVTVASNYLLRNITAVKSKTVRIQSKFKHNSTYNYYAMTML